jgi:hypothetical protein
MTPDKLQVGSFAAYPPQARALAIHHMKLMNRTPLILLAALLRQVIQYDWSFPAEREQLVRQLNLLDQLDVTSFDSLVSPFAAIPFSRELSKFDYLNHPQHFSEKLTAYLWEQQLSDNYHNVAQAYQQYLEKALPQTQPVTPRWTIVVIGRGSQQTEYSLFRHLMPHGMLFTKLDSGGALEVLSSAVVSRAHQFPLDYQHWYIDGGEPDSIVAKDSRLTTMSYAKLVPAAMHEFALMKEFTSRGASNESVGPEAVASYIAGLSPEDLALKGDTSDAALRHFEVNLITQGAGCQIFSTTFVQWAARECLHRAQPLTLFARFSTRQSNAPMEQLLARNPLQQPQDIEGSLIDADMGAYYTWINQSRLPGAQESRFLVWFEDHNLACVISPTLSGGKTFTGDINMRQLLEHMA